MSYKKHIMDTMKRLYTNKYISIRDGNVSFKPKNENYFYISAGQIRKDILNEDQVIEVNFEKKKNYVVEKKMTNIIYFMIKITNINHLVKYICILIYRHWKKILIKIFLLYMHILQILLHILD